MQAHLLQALKARHVVDIQRNKTRAVQIGIVTIGDYHPIAVQSMTATKTTDVDATVALVKLMQDAGADVVRIAVDSKKDAAALAEIRQQTQRQSFGRSAGELSAGRNRRAARRQNPLQPGAPLPSRNGKTVAGESPLHCRHSRPITIVRFASVSTAAASIRRRKKNTIRTIRSLRCWKVPLSIVSFWIRSASLATAFR